MVSARSRKRTPSSKHRAAAAPSTPADDVRRRLLAFVLERHPLAFEKIAALLDDLPVVASLDAVRDSVTAGLSAAFAPPPDLGETTPGVSSPVRFAQATAALRDDLDGFFAREQIRATITDDERRAMLAGMLLTRAVDNRLKHLFVSGAMKYEGVGFQGKGFRSTGQEAIFAAGLRLKRGPAYQGDGGYTGDVIGPLIRDLGLVLAFTDDVTAALNAQVGKSGPPLDGKDLHNGDLVRGVLPAAAPLSIATCMAVGAGFAMKLRAQPRVALSFIGEGGSSLGEWHEAINIAATHQLPVVFCVQNNQTALSTPRVAQSKVRVFADKALGYGIPAITVDGTSPEDVAAAFAQAANRARQGQGPTLIELVAMRLCGHAHHDDMLYLGADPPLDFSLDYELKKTAYANPDLYARWRARDPIATYAARLQQRGVITEQTFDEMKAHALARVDAATEELMGRPWPAPEKSGAGVFSDGPVLAHPAPTAVPALPAPRPLVVEDAPPFDRKGKSYLDAVGLGLADVLAAHDEAFVYGEDVAAPYGNAFLLVRPVLEKFSDRVINAPIAEGGIIGVLVGAALEGMLPIGEMQFNDFVASGFNALVNSAAKFRYRTGKNLPLVLRMPWGGLRRAGPYHSQDTAPWFYRAFGLKIVAPSTPHDARALLNAAVADPDPVLFYEHIALYREPAIKQVLGPAPADIPLGKAALRKAGDDLCIISYGAFVHRALDVARALDDEGAAVSVLDLRSLCPLDWPAITERVRACGKVLLVGEDSKTGSILESIASKLSESQFEHLDGPVRVLGALDTPVPYAPSLEDAFLISSGYIADTARAMLAW